MTMQYHAEGDLAVLTIDDGKVNAMGPRFFEDLNRALDRAERERPGALVIAGRPGCFSAGLDLKQIPRLSPDAQRATLVAFGDTLLRVFALPLPTVAAMTGHAIAGGAFLGFGCDLRVMAEGPYRLHVNEVAIGLTLPTFARVITESVCDVRWRTETMLCARACSPADALARGLVSELRAPDDVLPRACELAVALTKLDRASYEGTKRRARDAALREAQPSVAREMTGVPGNAAA